MSILAHTMSMTALYSRRYPGLSVGSHTPPHVLDHTVYYSMSHVQRERKGPFRHAFRKRGAKTMHATDSSTLDLVHAPSSPLSRAGRWPTSG